MAKTNPHLEKINQNLTKGEKIQISVEGVIKNSKGILALTNKAIYFEGKVLWESESEALPLEKVVSVSNSSGMIFGEIKIKTQGESITIKNIQKKDSEAFIKEYRKSEIK